jgi:TPR repeat protein
MILIRILIQSRCTSDNPPIHLDERKTSMFKRQAAKASVSFADLRALTPHQWQAALAGDPAIAAQWLTAAAKYGFVEAQTALGQSYLDGRGVPKDATAAVTWFAAAAQGRYAPGLNMLGRCYERGWGCVADFPRAADCYRQAAEAGLDWGQYNLANMLLGAGYSVIGGRRSAGTPARPRWAMPNP